eukprot:NODE_6906_length_809_cov_46.274052_g6670_i0.p1 GENE.NODE_6906_length_809_cov_46.274052_g6670_i0~~NODE_6906_length_809_cov_46.274052_g6670_i0.p1  ORF type:complete len:197 (-),score=6.16 NODE_6906_length_809_cov_46.274052_g6670_i0:148-738(-)
MLVWPLALLAICCATQHADARTTTANTCGCTCCVDGLCADSSECRSAMLMFGLIFGILAVVAICSATAIICCHRRKQREHSRVVASVPQTVQPWRNSATPVGSMVYGNMPTISNPFNSISPWQGTGIPQGYGLPLAFDTDPTRYAGMGIQDSSGVQGQTVTVVQAAAHPTSPSEHEPDSPPYQAGPPPYRQSFLPY